MDIPVAELWSTPGRSCGMRFARLRPQAQASYCTSVGCYQQLLLKSPSVDAPMFSMRQIDWQHAFLYWNVRWVQATFICLALYFLLYCLWALPNVFIIISCAWKVVVSMVVTLSVGHAGWYVVRERNGCRGWVLHIFSVWGLCSLRVARSVLGCLAMRIGACAVGAPGPRLCLAASRTAQVDGLQHAADRIPDLVAELARERSHLAELQPRVCSL